MKLLVSGGLGFIGSNFIIKLLKESNDYEILNIDAELYGADHRNLSQIQNSEKYEFIKGTITNKKLMEEQIKKCDKIMYFVNNIDFCVELGEMVIEIELSASNYP